MSILSYLPLRDAARSTVLSSRWRHLFDQSLLDFNACQPFPPEGGRGCDWVIHAIDSILAAPRHIPIRSFRFVMYGKGFIKHTGTVARWFRTLASRGVRELDVDMLYTVPKPPLPALLLQFASLQTLRVCHCDLPDYAQAGALWLPVLRTLDLSNVGVTQHTLQAMLSHCPSLECAKLKNITGAGKICLRSKSLTRLYGDFGNLKELVITDAPNLEELVGIGLPSGAATLKIDFAPKLQVLGYLGKSVRPLVLRDTIFDGGIVQSRTLMSSVKTLAIQVPFSEKGYTVFVTQLLKCFPCLEVFCIEPDNRSDPRRVNIENWDTTTSIQCVEHTINKLAFECFEGEWYQWDFLTFLLGMARALKIVEIYFPKSKDCYSNGRQPVSSINRVSQDVEFLVFRTYELTNNMYLCHCCPARCHKQNKVLLPCEI